MKKLLLILLVALSPILIIAQGNGTITGKVVDSGGIPLVGANVIAVNTLYGAATDTEGNYTISLPAGTYTVSARYIGFETQTLDNVVVIEDQTTSLDFQLDDQAFLSSDVVVIGYGVQQKREVTGSVTSVKMQTYAKVPTLNSAAALQGQATGVNIEFNDGAPATNANIKIRGTGTVNDNDPLFVIDGVPSEINYVSPSDIESIDILKDASSAAIYGARAANGVILISTKRGKRNMPVVINFKTFIGSQSLDKQYDVLNTSQYANHMATMLTNAGEPIPGWVTDIQSNPGNWPSTSWQDIYYQDAPMRNYELSMAGGSDWINYSIAGSYAKRDGIVMRTGQEKTSIRINSDITKGKFKIGQSLSLTRAKNQYQSHGGWEGGYRVLTVPSVIPLYDPSMPGGYGQGDPANGLPLMENPIAFQAMRDNDETFDYILASIYGEYEIIDDLKFKIQASKNIEEFYDYEFGRTFGVPSLAADNYLYELRGKTDHTIVENTLTYKLNIDSHNITAMAGYAREQKDYRDIYGGVSRLPSETTNVLSIGEKDPYISGGAWSDRLESLFGRIIYDYDDKYLFQFNIRRDGSSRFNTEDRYGVFPSASIGWRISKEPFFSSITEINDLKLRASYGVLGNNQIDRYAYIAGLYINPGSSEFGYVFGDDQQVYTGAAFPNIASGSIKWETSKTIDFGLDMALFDNMIEVTADYYQKTTENMLLNIPLPWSAGVWEGPIANVGEVKNTGFELSSSYRNFEGDFKYSISANFSTYANEVVKLSGVEGDAYFGGYLEYGDTNPVTKTEVGHEIGAFWLWETGGIFQSDQEVLDHTGPNGEVLQPNAQPGDMIFNDTNNDGVLSDDDRVYMGSAIPDFELGLNFYASYKNFDITAFIYGAFGRDLFNAARWQLERMSEWENQSTAVLDAWTPTNTDTDVPRAVFTDPNQNSRPSDRFLEDASYLRIKNIEIGYTIPQSLLKYTGLSKARVYVSAENLVTITGYSGYDPGVSGGSVFARGVDRAVYPFAKTYIMGIDLSF